MSKSGILPVFSSRSFTFRSLICFDLFLYMVLESVLISFFYMRLSSFTSTTYWRDCLFSIVYFASFVVDNMSIGVWVYFWAFYPVPLICISVFMPVLYCFDDCGFVVRKPDSSSSIFFFLKIVLSILHLLCFHTNFILFL